MLTPRKQSRFSGFTMIELLVGIAILGILASIAIPSFRAWIQNTQIRNAASSIVNGLQRARSEAISRNINVEFVLADDSSWVIRVASGVEIESKAASEGARYVTVTRSPDGNNIITYNSLGGVQTTNLDASPPFDTVDLDTNAPNITAEESREMKILISVGGKARMCDPNAVSGAPSAC